MDLIIRHSLHQFSQVFVKGLSDYHPMVYTMLKSTYAKIKNKNFNKSFL